MYPWRRIGGRIAATLAAGFPDACLLCGAPADDVPNLCRACAEHLPRADTRAGGSVIAHAYTPPVSNLVHWMKFQGSLPAARTLGALLAEAVAAAGPRPPDALVPVPLHARRLRERGFNQALELARPLARQLGCPVLARACRRVRATQAQSGLVDLVARRRNVAGAFRVERSLAHLRRIAIVDDVLTTGATVEELGRVLRAAGVAQVVVWVCAGRLAAGAMRPGWRPTERCSR